MEIKKEDLIITSKWLEDREACKRGVLIFKKYFPNGGYFLDVLKRCEELNYQEYVRWLEHHLYFSNYQYQLYQRPYQNIFKRYNLTSSIIEKLKNYYVNGDLSLFKSLSTSKGEIDEKTDYIDTLITCAKIINKIKKE